MRLSELLNEELQDVWEDYDDVKDEVWQSFNQNKPVPFKVTPKDVIFSIWKQYAKDGFVRNESLVNKIAERFIHNVLVLQVNTEWVGHTQLIPEEDEDYPEFQNNEVKNNFYDWTNQAFSDYGLEPLWKLVEKLSNAIKSEEKVQIMDQMLNVVHTRSDMASYFIEGGQESLSELSNITNLYESKILLEKFNLHPYYKPIYDDIYKIFDEKNMDEDFFKKSIEYSLDYNLEKIIKVHNKNNIKVLTDIELHWNDLFEYSANFKSLYYNNGEYLKMIFNVYIPKWATLERWLLGGSSVDDKVRKTVTHNISDVFLHEVEHSLQVLNINPKILNHKEKYHEIISKQTPYKENDTPEQYYKSINEIDAFATNVGRDLLSQIDDVNIIKKNINNEEFMIQHSPNYYNRYKTYIKGNYPKAWKRFLRKIYQYISEKDNNE